jgi:hypothetical protein
MNGYKRRNRFKKKNKAAIPRLVLEIGRVYLVTKYHTGNFRGKVIATGNQTASLQVVDAMKTELQVGALLDVWLCHAEFTATVFEQFQGPKTLAVQAPAPTGDERDARAFLRRLR